MLVLPGWFSKHLSIKGPGSSSPSLCLMGGCANCFPLLSSHNPLEAVSMSHSMLSSSEWNRKLLLLPQELKLPQFKLPRVFFFFFLETLLICAAPGMPVLSTLQRPLSSQRASEHCKIIYTAKWFWCWELNTGSFHSTTEYIST